MVSSTLVNHCGARQVNAAELPTLGVLPAVGVALGWLMFNRKAAR